MCCVFGEHEQSPFCHSMKWAGTVQSNLTYWRLDGSSCLMFNLVLDYSYSMLSRNMLFVEWWLSRLSTNVVVSLNFLAAIMVIIMFAPHFEYRINPNQVHTWYNNHSKTGVCTYANVVETSKGIVCPIHDGYPLYVREIGKTTGIKPCE